MKNVLVNVTLPSEVVEYLDKKAEETYITRATVAKQFLMEHVDEQKVTEARKKGFSIRKVAEITGVRYDKVLEILRRTGIDEEIDEELEQYMDNVAKGIRKKK